LFKYSPCGHIWPRTRGLNVYIVIYREIIKNVFFSSTAAPNGIMFSMEPPQDKDI